jgi:hypothetical protein
MQSFAKTAYNSIPRLKLGTIRNKVRKQGDEK